MFLSLSETELQRLRQSLHRLEVAGGVAAESPVDELDAVAVLRRLIAAARQLHAQRGTGLDAAASPTSGSLACPQAEPGDATVHFGCGLHAGPPPTGEKALHAGREGRTHRRNRGTQQHTQRTATTAKPKP